MARNIAGLKRGFHYNPASRGLGIYVDGVQVEAYTATVGRTYYVNNVTGSSGADGLSWGSAMDEISTAITASEAYRQLGGDPGGRATTQNDYVRNTIIIQGTGEYDNPYAALTALPLHCNIVGLGDWPAGLGQGMVMIGEIDGNENAILASTTVRGLNLLNLHCWADNDAANTYAALSVANFYRSRLEDCWFGQASGLDNIDAGIYCNDVFSGNLVRHCMIGQTNSGGRPRYGMNFQSCTIGNNNLIEDNVIFGDTTGIIQTATDNWNGTVIRNNTIGSITGQCSGPPIVTAYYEYIVDNRCFGASTLTLSSANQAAGNIVNVGGVTVTMDLLDT